MSLLSNSPHPIESDSSEKDFRPFSTMTETTFWTLCYIITLILTFFALYNSNAVEDNYSSVQHFPVLNIR